MPSKGREFYFLEAIGCESHDSAAFQFRSIEALHLALAAVRARDCPGWLERRRAGRLSLGRNRLPSPNRIRVATTPNYLSVESAAITSYCNTFSTANSSYGYRAARSPGTVNTTCRTVIPAAWQNSTRHIRKPQARSKTKPAGAVSISILS